MYKILDIHLYNAIQILIIHRLSLIHTQSLYYLGCLKYTSRNVEQRGARYCHKQAQYSQRAIRNFKYEQDRENLKTYSSIRKRAS